LNRRVLGFHQVPNCERLGRYKHSSLVMRVFDIPSSSSWLSWNSLSLVMLSMAERTHHHQVALWFIAEIPISLVVHLQSLTAAAPLTRKIGRDQPSSPPRGPRL
jgi:hypothetical protein